MPTYEYACTSCAEHIEVVQSFTDASLTECPSCSGRLRKVFSPVGVVFKGSGFYKTDSRDSKSTSKSTKSESKSDGKSESKSETKSDGASTSTSDSGSSSATKSDSGSSSTSSAPATGSAAAAS